MDVKLYNQTGKSEKEVKLPEVFDLKINERLLHQVVVSQASNQRQATADSKDRAEVRGGGRKPWRQKGTGRARVGSRRSPLWKGGGVTFGPQKERNYKKTIPAKMRKQALYMAIASKAKDGNLLLISDLNFDKVSSKAMASFLKALPLKKGSVLIATEKNNKKAVLSARNLPQVGIEEARNLNALDLLQSKYLLLEQGALKAL